MLSLLVSSGNTSKQSLLSFFLQQDLHNSSSLQCDQPIQCQKRATLLEFLLDKTPHHSIKLVCKCCYLVCFACEFLMYLKSFYFVVSLKTSAKFCSTQMTWVLKGSLQKPFSSSCCLAQQGRCAHVPLTWSCRCLFVKKLLFLKSSSNVNRHPLLKNMC